MMEEKRKRIDGPVTSSVGENRVFLDSLEDLQASDFLRPEEGGKKGKKKNRPKNVGWFSTLLLVLCVGVFLYCAGQIVYSLIEDSRSTALYDDYSEKYRDVMAPDPVSVLNLERVMDASPMKSYDQIAKEGADIFDPSTYIGKQVKSAKLQKMLVFLGELKNTNPDTYGYISIEGTRINYPVVQSQDNAFYLIHGFDGDSLKSGSIFADWRNSRIITDNFNTVFYGHNMTTGAMFHDLLNFLNEDFFNSNQIVVTTFDGIYTYEVFSIHESLANINYFQTFFANDAEFIRFCKDQEALSDFHKEGITFSGDSRILTLSTCSNNGNTNGRYAVHAILVKIER